jgi:DNA repair photolyase
MILSVSRRTDIPALYSDWFLERVREGFVLVPNPFPIARKQVARIKIEPVKVTTNLLGGKEVSGNVDGVIFWTKNPRPMMEKRENGVSVLEELDRRGFVYYFHFTLNPYGPEIEKNVAPIEERIKTFQELAERIGAERVIWRYDPILLSKTIGVEWHLREFERIARRLNGFTKVVHFSFLIGKHKDFRAPNWAEQNEIVKNFARIAGENGIQLCACALKNIWAEYGVKQSRCTDPELFSKLCGGRVKTRRLDGQRKDCGCMPCVDIGIYNTCAHGCVYCYANGFYAYRGEARSMFDAPEGTEYERVTERIFDY